MGCGQTPARRAGGEEMLDSRGAGRRYVHERGVGGRGGTVGVPFGYRWGAVGVPLVYLSRRPRRAPDGGPDGRLTAAQTGG